MTEELNLIFIEKGSSFTKALYENNKYRDGEMAQLLRAKDLSPVLRTVSVSARSKCLQLRLQVTGRPLLASMDTCTHV